ncbi:hypothetical protein PENTCL1PPCAC_7156, partial [Pristionchus entomophagus]
MPSSASGSAPATFLHKVIAAVSFAALLHAAYSAAQHRLYLRLTEQPFTALPADIVAQTLASLIFLCWACTHVAGAFQPIRADIANGRRRWDDVGSCLSFVTFEHRAKALSPTYALDSGRAFTVSL